jgi:hypothetical protein
MTAPSLTVRGSGNNTALAMGCGVLFLLPFAGVGVFTTVQALRAAAAANWSQAGFFSIFALTFGGVGFGGLVALAAGRRRLADAETRQTRNPDAPWLWWWRCTPRSCFRSCSACSSCFSSTSFSSRGSASRG